MPQSQQETINATLIEANEKRIPIQPGIFASLGGISSHHQEQSGTLDFKFIRFHVSVKVGWTKWEKMSFMKITKVCFYTQ